MFPPEEVALPNVKDDDLDDVPERGRRMARPDGDHKKIIDSGKWRKAVSAYLASIAFADAMVGRVIDAFDQSPDRDNTVIVLWSDHGWHLGEKLHWRKFSLWEEATHNVLMVVAPGFTKPARRCGRPVSLLDIYPTLLEICGLPPAAGVEGTSFVPLLNDPGMAWARPALTTYMRGNHSVRTEEWRYIRYADGSEELYDRKNDELEWVNLARETRYADVTKELARHLPAVDAEDSPIRKGASEGD
jgi:arylsulfatase A-like enzyme